MLYHLIHILLWVQCNHIDNLQRTQREGFEIKDDLYFKNLILPSCLVDALEYCNPYCFSIGWLSKSRIFMDFYLPDIQLSLRPLNMMARLSRTRRVVKIITSLKWDDIHVDGLLSLLEINTSRFSRVGAFYQNRQFCLSVKPSSLCCIRHCQLCSDNNYCKGQKWRFMSMSKLSN